MRTREFERSCPISVVIPALNEKEEIGECLESMHQQSFPYFEVTVADNGSTVRDRIHRTGARSTRNRGKGTWIELPAEERPLPETSH